MVASWHYYMDQAAAVAPVAPMAAPLRYSVAHRV